MKRIQEGQLNNGIKYLFYPRDGKTFVINVLVKAGSKHDPDNKNGLAHMVEHLVVSGSSEYPTPRGLGAILLSNGGVSDIYTDREFVKLETTTTLENTEDGFKYLNQVIFHPLINNETIVREKKIIAQEIQGYDVDKNRLFDKMLNDMVWPNSWKSREIIGTIKSVEKLTTEDAIKFHLDHYRPEDLQITISGSYDESAVIGFLNKYFEK
jgi:predicted Zn-dependent peptidase